MAGILYLLSTFFTFAPFILLSGDALPPASAAENSTEFICSRCGATRYPGLCYASIAGYSSTVRQSPAQLARVAANLTVSRLASLSALVASLLRACVAGGAACPEAGALRDCADVLSDASELARRTSGELRELRELAEADGAASGWRVSNAQTWMSAVLTEEETCADGFEEVADGSRAKSDVVWRLRGVKQYTSNAVRTPNLSTCKSPIQPRIYHGGTYARSQSKHCWIG